jgi:catechol 2,3-dioxygenase-like lactoylglutathione lyase family enzyme
MIGPPLLAVRHVGIVVQDMERCLGFYRDVLGLTVKVAAEESGHFIDALLGEVGVQVRTVKLAAPKGQAMIELLEFRSPPADVRRPITVKTPGMTHVALTVADIDGLALRLIDAGAVFIGAPRISPDGGVKAAYVRDPEGNLLELVEER